jgi:hypothetical protein
VISPEEERARPSTASGATDAVTFAWGDPGVELYGLARIAIEGDGERGSVLAVLFAGREPVAAIARGELELPRHADFADLALPGLATTVRAPLRAWTVSFDGGASGFELDFEALGAPAELDAAEPFARAGGMAGSEQLCRVQGTARVAGAERAVHCLGQRSHAWGAPDWDGLEATRTLAAWLDDGTAISLATARPRGARAHADEVIWAALLDPAGNLHVPEPRLSTTYDGEGRQRRAGLELWMGDADDYPRRAAGEAVCGSTLDLGELRLDAAIFRWHMDGRSGIGRYDIVRRA